MTTTQKKEIAQLLEAYVKSCSSQKQASINLEVSEGTIIAMLRESSWGTLSYPMWMHVGKQIGWNMRRSKMVETMDFSTMVLYFTLAKENGETFALIGNSGSGKSYCGQWYADNMRKQNVFYLECAEYWNKKYFLIELMKSMGIESGGKNIYEMMEEIVYRLRRMNQPLIILDEVDKLKDEVLYFFITLYNKLHGLCGIIWTSTDYIVRRIDKGVNKNQKGFKEIKSRIGQRFIFLRGTDKNEVVQLCHANSITEEVEINRIFNEYNGDIRRIDRNYIKTVAKQKRA